MSTMKLSFLRATINQGISKTEIIGFFYYSALYYIYIHSLKRLAFLFFHCPHSWHMFLEIRVLKRKRYLWHDLCTTNRTVMTLNLPGAWCVTGFKHNGKISVSSCWKHSLIKCCYKVLCRTNRVFLWHTWQCSMVSKDWQYNMGNITINI